MKKFLVPVFCLGLLWLHSTRAEETVDSVDSPAAAKSRAASDRFYLFECYNGLQGLMSPSAGWTPVRSFVADNGGKFFVLSLEANGKSTSLACALPGFRKDTSRYQLLIGRDKFDAVYSANVPEKAKFLPANEASKGNYIKPVCQNDDAMMVGEVVAGRLGEALHRLDAEIDKIDVYARRPKDLNRLDQIVDAATSCNDGSSESSKMAWKLEDKIGRLLVNSATAASFEQYTKCMKQNDCPSFGKVPDLER